MTTDVLRSRRRAGQDQHRAEDEKEEAEDRQWGSS